MTQMLFITIIIFIAFIFCVIIVIQFVNKSADENSSLDLPVMCILILLLGFLSFSSFQVYLREVRTDAIEHYISGDYEIVKMISNNKEYHYYKLIDP